MTDDELSPFIFGAKYVRHRLGLAGPLPGRRAHEEDSFAAGVQAMGAVLARLHPSEASRVLAECNAIGEALAPPRPRHGHRFAAGANEYTLVIAGQLRTIRIVD